MKTIDEATVCGLCGKQEAIGSCSTCGKWLCQACGPTCHGGCRYVERQ
jgi:hypothetical protein